ncbi:MAG: tRNA (guanosine(46)-N7)-methyltransferase TrmB [Eubacteriales bacterium]|nr:tRNA (guanosine(46)-N7)-methyltransferase TrmB [Eubacteriales bacterium]
MRLRNIPGAKDVIRNSPYVIQNPEEKRGRLTEAFPQKQPLHIEVGMGKGRFLMDMARLHPEVNYIGIEMYDSVLLRAIQKREEQRDAGEVLSNLLFLRVDARLLLEIFEKGEVDRIYLNFSDPWPKARHAKRRLTSREFLARYDQILAGDGTVEFKTDNQELFSFSLEEVREAGWQVLAHTFDLHGDEALAKGNVMTEYEEKFSSMGNPICKMVIRR